MTAPDPTEAASEALRDAIQTYIREVHDERLMVIDHVVAYSAVDMHAAHKETFIGTELSGPIHSVLGLAHLLANDITNTADGSDNE